MTLLKSLMRTAFCALTIASAGAMQAQELPGSIPQLDESLVREGTASLQRGVAYLLSKQAEDGSWSGHPAITSLACMALKNANTPDDAAARAAAIEKGRRYMLKFVQPDGSIWMSGREREYPTYTTAITLAGLAILGNADDEAVMRGARKYLLDLQLNEGNAIAPTDKSNPNYGGVGYGKDPRGAAHVDLSNTQWAFEALYLTDYLDKEPKAQSPEDTKKSDLAWGNLVTFLSRMQNLPETNDQTWVVSDKDDPNYGGFVYRVDNRRGGPGGEGRPDGQRGPRPDGKEQPQKPDGQPGAKPEGEAGKVIESGKPLITEKTGAKPTLRSYGSMTYAGLKSMIYARLKKDDPRVQAAVEWAARNYTLDVNPGVGPSGLYYYINTFSKAHSALGDEIVKTPDGQNHFWRRDVVKKLLELQKGEGQWVNDDGRWMESNPELVTCYSLISMEAALAPYIQQK